MMAEVGVHKRSIIVLKKNFIERTGHRTEPFFIQVYKTEAYTEVHELETKKNGYLVPVGGRNII